MTAPQPFPAINIPFVDDARILTRPWQYFLQALWSRTGGGAGGGAVVTGSVVIWPTQDIPGGYLLCDGAEYGVEQFPDLFRVLGGVESSPGQFRVPNYSGGFLLGADGGRPAGSGGGNATATLGQENLPDVELPVTDPGHFHSVADPGHSHGITDPGHSHDVPVSVATPGPAASSSITTGGDVTTSTETTGISVNTAATGLTVNPADTGVTVRTGGSGVPVSIIPPYRAVNFIIRT